MTLAELCKLELPGYEVGFLAYRCPVCGENVAAGRPEAVIQRARAHNKRRHHGK